mmetsp:Transcript_24712/g.54421  ORF Transcript_24712/g.54421 Transcript_24712/m.54421 type:complete len:80 (-) Transcript_24712:308-547(-)
MAGVRSSSTTATATTNLQQRDTQRVSTRDAKVVDERPHSEPRIQTPCSEILMRYKYTKTRLRVLIPKKRRSNNADKTPP